MQTKPNQSTKRFGVKILLIGVISLLLGIPLLIVEGIINDREAAKDKVTTDVTNSYAGQQVVGGPTLRAVVMTKAATDSTDMKTRNWDTQPTILNYTADVETDVLRRSIYDVIIYKSTIQITGTLPIGENTSKAFQHLITLDITDFKGLSALPKVTFGEQTYRFNRVNDQLQAQVTLPQNTKVHDEIPFAIELELKGTESLMFSSFGKETSLTINSSYPHPSFQGAMLPITRDVRDDGFSATWKVLQINMGSLRDTMGVRFVDPANPYQQATRSAKYGLLIVALVFVAGLFVEYLTKKEIHLIQYAVIGLSLILFYILLLSISEFMVFGWAYLIAALMIIAALICYFRGILKSRSAYILGSFIAAVYVVNYVLLQMETYALLAGSLVLFVLLSVVMYLTANMNTKAEQPALANAETEKPEA